MGAKGDIVISADRKRQPSSQLRRLIKTCDKMIEKDEYKLAHPSEFYAGRDRVSDKITEGKRRIRWKMLSKSGFTTRFSGLFIKERYEEAQQESYEG